MLALLAAPHARVGGVQDAWLADRACDSASGRRLFLFTRRLLLHALFERGEALLHRGVRGAKLLHFVAKLFDFERALLQLRGALVERLDGGEAHTREVLYADGGVARAESERLVEVFGHRTHVLRLRTLGDVVPGRDRNAAQASQHVFAVNGEEVLFRVAARRAVEDARTGRQVAARRAAEVRAEAEAARGARRELVVRSVAEGVRARRG